MSLIGIIVGMAVVTFLPRFLPAVLVNRFTPPKWFQNWLEYIPYAALGALIFPGILTVEASAPWIGLGGGLVALVLALLRFHILYGIFGSILFVLLMKWTFL